MDIGPDPQDLLARVRACRHCESVLPLPPRPLIRASPTARLLIVAQAPGQAAHLAGCSFDDRSGDRLRYWLGLDRAQFYDEERVAIMSMGFCYPGTDRRGGDHPPRPECAPLWHPPLLRWMGAIKLTLLVGAYAHRRYLPDEVGDVTRTVAGWRDHLPRYFPLPHPSWRNTGWIKRNPWFEAEALPALRRRVAEVI
jgi:uracil-DNA glycosylase